MLWVFSLFQVATDADLEQLLSMTWDPNVALAITTDILVMEVVNRIFICIFEVFFRVLHNVLFKLQSAYKSVLRSQYITEASGPALQIRSFYLRKCMNYFIALRTLALFAVYQYRIWQCHHPSKHIFSMFSTAASSGLTSKSGAPRKIFFLGLFYRLHHLRPDAGLKKLNLR